MEPSTTTLIPIEGTNMNMYINETTQDIVCQQHAVDMQELAKLGTAQIFALRCELSAKKTSHLCKHNNEHGIVCHEEIGA